MRREDAPAPWSLLSQEGDGALAGGRSQGNRQWAKPAPLRTKDDTVPAKNSSHAHSLPAPDEMLTEDLLVLLSGSDRARELVSRYGVSDLPLRSQAELAEVGLTPGAARRVACAFELGRR